MVRNLEGRESGLKRSLGKEKLGEEVWREEEVEMWKERDKTGRENGGEKRNLEAKGEKM